MAENGAMLQGKGSTINLQKYVYIKIVMKPLCGVYYYIIAYRELSNEPSQHVKCK